MLGFLAELLLQLLFDALFQLLAEVLFELGFEAIAHSLRRADQPIQSWLRSVYSSSAPRLDSLRVGFFPIRCFGRFATSRGSVSFLRRLQLGVLCTYLDLGAAEQVVTQLYSRPFGAARCSPSRWVRLAQSALGARDARRRTSGCSGPGLALLAPAAEPAH